MGEGMRTTRTHFYIGGRITERPNVIENSINAMEDDGWRVQAMMIGMGGMWVVYEKDQK